MPNIFKITWRAARVNRGLTLEEVAEISGKSKDTVMRYEKDSSSIPYDLKNLWLSLYDVPEEFIYFGLESDLIGKSKAS